MNLPRPDQHCTPEEYDRRKIARMLAQIKPVASGCHEWQGYVNTDTGYAMTNYRGKTRIAHRLLWILVKGPVPRKIDVCHTCDNRKCCNFDHLWLGTRQQNLQDAANKGRVHCQQKTHCPRGHEYTGDALWVDKFGWRHCRICSRIKQRIAAGWTEQEATSMAALSPRDRGLYTWAKRRGANQ